MLQKNAKVPSILQVFIYLAINLSIDLNAFSVKCTIEDATLLCGKEMAESQEKKSYEVCIIKFFYKYIWISKQAKKLKSHKIKRCGGMDGDEGGAVFKLRVSITH